MAEADAPDRARRVGGIVVVALVAAGAMHLFDQRATDARVLEVQAADAAQLADVEERSARQSIELQGQLASCELERHHAALPVVGESTVDATVELATGATTIGRGTACRVELDWNADPIEGCRALVRCGDTFLYGGVGTGHFDCTVDDHGLVRGQDANPTAEGGDPRLVVDREAQRLTVSDDDPTWSVTLAVVF